MRTWNVKTDINVVSFVKWLDISRSKYYSWQSRYGKVNEHNSWIPRDHWLTQDEKQAIINYYQDNPTEGYRRLAYMMLDKDIAAASPSAVYKVLKNSGLLKKWNRTPSKKGTGFHQPSKPHHHWHIDVSYINICGTFYYLCGLIDGYSRYIVHWEIRERMTEKEIEIIIQRAKEKFPQATPRIISDNGPQFIAKDFKEFIRIIGMTHVKTSPYYPQSNGKIERWHKTLKGECIRVKTPLSLEEARIVISEFVVHYNSVRLHSGIGYIAPQDKLFGEEEIIFKERDRKLEQARERRKQAREKLNAVTANIA